MPVFAVARRSFARPRSLRGGLAVGGVLLCMVGLSACGSSGTTATPSGAASGGGGAAAGGAQAIALTATQKSCLKKAGVTLPAGGRGGPGGGTRPAGAPPSGGAGASASTPAGPPRARGTGGRGGMSTAARSKLQAAAKACGVTLAARPQGAPSGTPSGAALTPSTDTTAATS
jgi:hypothetical protein